MASSIASLAVDVSANIGRLRSDFQNANKMATQQFGQMRRNVEGSLTAMEARARNTGRAVLASLGAIGTIEIAKRLAGVADGYQNVQSKIRLVTTSQRDFVKTSEEALAVAQRTYTSYDSVASLVGRTTRALEGLGQSNEVALGKSLALSEVIAKGLAVGGATAQEASASIIQLTQALSSNKLAGDEFRSFMENAPRLAVGLAQSLGVSIGELRQLSLEGKLSTEIVVEGLLLQAKTIEKEFSQVPLTVGRAWQLLSNDFMVYIGQGTEATGITRGLANALIYLGKNLDTIGKLFAGGFLLYANRQMAVAAGAVIAWYKELQMGVAWSQAIAINASKEAAAQLESARATVTSAEAKVAEARASAAQVVGTQAVIVTAREELAAKLASLTVEEAKIATTIAAARAAGAQSFALGILAEAEVALTRVQMIRTGVITELAALGAANTRSMAAQVAAADALIAAEVGLAEAQTAAAAAATRAAAAQTAAGAATGIAATGIRGLGASLLTLVGGPIGLAIAGVAALAYGLYALRESEDAAIGGADAMIDKFNQMAASAHQASTDPVKLIDEEEAKAQAELIGMIQKRTEDLNEARETLASMNDPLGMDQVSIEIGQASDDIAAYNQKLKDLAAAAANAKKETIAGKAAAEESAAAFRAQAEALRALIDGGGDKGDKDSGAAKTQRELDRLIESQVKFAATTEAMQAAMLGPGAQAWAEYIAQVNEANAAYIAGETNMSGLIEREAVLKLQYEKANKEIKQQQDYLDKLAKDTKYEKSLIRMTDRQRVFAEAFHDAKEYAEANSQSFAEAGVSAEEYAQRVAEAAQSTFDVSEGSKALQEALTELGGKSGLEELIDKMEEMEEAVKAAFDADSVEAFKEALENLKIKKHRNDVLATRNAYLDMGAAIVGGLKDAAQEGSRSYAALEVAQAGIALGQGIIAILTQGQGDPISAWGRMAAMAAVVIPLAAQLGASIKAFGGSGFSDTAAQRQESQGTGSVLGDSEAKSESAQNALDITADATSEMVGIQRGMLSALLALQAGLGSAAVMLARGAGTADFSGFDLAVGENFALTNRVVDPFGFFGGSSKITDEGIVIFGGALTDMLNGIAVGAYQEVQSRSWAFGSTHTNEAIVDVSDEFAMQFQLIVSSIVDTVREGALALGILPEEVQAALDAYAVEEIRISLKGLSAEEQQAELAAVFSELFDGLAGSVVPFIGQFQRVGEGLGETLVRVATEVQVMQEAIKYLGISIDETDPEKFAQISDSLINMVGGIDDFITQMNSFVNNFDTDQHRFEVAAQALNSAFEQAGLQLPTTADGFWDLMQSLDATTEEGQAQIATLLRLNEVAADYYDMLEDQTKNYLEMIGVIAPALSKFRQTMTDIAEQEQEYIRTATAYANATGRYGQAERDLVAIHRWAVDQTRAAIAALRTSTMDLVSQLYGGAPGSMDEINRRIAAQEELYNNELGYIDDVASASRQRYEDEIAALERLQGFVDSLLLGNLSTLTPEQQLGEAQAQYLETLAAAQAGDLDALAALPDIAQTYLEIAQGYYSTTNGFTQISDSVIAALNAILSAGPQSSPGVSGSGNGNNGGGSGNSELDALYAQRDALQAQQDLANRLALAEQLAQQLNDLALALNVPLFELADQMGVNIQLLVTDLGVNLDELTESTGGQLAAIAEMLGVGLPELVAQLGLSMMDLVEAMGLNFDDLGTLTGAALLNVASELGLSVVELVDSLGLSMGDIVEAMGVNLSDFSVETAIALADLAGQMGLSLTELAEAVGQEVGTLVEAQSLLNDALEQVIAGLPEGIRGNLQDLFDDIAEATTEADANAAVQALRDATLELPEEYRDLLAPFFEAIDPTEQLSDLAYLQLLSEAADWQSDLLFSIKGYASQIAENTGSAASSTAATAASTASAATSAASAAAYVVTGPMGDDNSSQSVVSAIVEMKDSMIESGEMSQMMILNRLSALEEAINGSGNRVAMAVGKSSATRKSY